MIYSYARPASLQPYTISSLCFCADVSDKFPFSNLMLLKARAGIQEIHFLPFNPTDKRTALTYIDREGKMHRVSKGAPEQVTCYQFISVCNILCYAYDSF